MMKDISDTTDKQFDSFVIEPISESLNGKLKIVTCFEKTKGSDDENQIGLKLYMLETTWPDYPFVVERKNRFKLREYVTHRKTGQSVQSFIKSVIHQIYEMSSFKNKCLLPVAERGMFPTELFVSNKGSRISFWLNDQQFGILGKQPEIVAYFKGFSWVTKKKEVYQTPIEYGSTVFINLVERLSLKPIMGILSCCDYEELIERNIEDGLYEALKLVNFCYRFFFPPADQQKKLKKQSYLTVSTNQPLKGISQSHIWAEDVLLSALFEIRPVKKLQKLLTSGPSSIYNQGLLFSEVFYGKVQSVYYFNEIRNYLGPSSITNKQQYLALSSRCDTGCLLESQSQKDIQILSYSQWADTPKFQKFQSKVEEVQISSESSSDGELQDRKPKPKLQTKKNKELFNQQVIPGYPVIQELFRKSQTVRKQIVRQQLMERVQILANNKKNQPSDRTFEEYKSRKQSLERVYKAFQKVSLFHCRSKCAYCDLPLNVIHAQQATYLQALNQIFIMLRTGSPQYCPECIFLTPQQRKQRFVLAKNQQQAKKQSLKQYEDQQLKQKNVQKDHMLFTEMEEYSKMHEQNDSQNKTVERFGFEVPENLSEQNNQSIKPSVVTSYKKQQTTADIYQIESELFSIFESKSQQIMVRQKVRPILFCEKYLHIFYALKEQPIKARIQDEFCKFHDSLNLSQLSAQLTCTSQNQKFLIKILKFYLKILSTNPRQVENQQVNFQPINCLVPTVKQEILQRSCNSIMKRFAEKCVKDCLIFQKDRNILNRKKQVQFFKTFFEMIERAQSKLNTDTCVHYQIYKSGLTTLASEKVETQDVAKILLLELKENIGQSTLQFIKTAKILTSIICDYLMAKSDKIKRCEIQPHNSASGKVSLLLNEFDSILNLCAVLTGTCNHPGQGALVSPLEEFLIELLFWVISLQKQLRLHQKKSTKLSILTVIQQANSTFEILVSEKTSATKEEKRVLIKKHGSKFMKMMNSKLSQFKEEKTFDQAAEFRQLRQKFYFIHPTAYFSKDVYEIGDSDCCMSCVIFKQRSLTHAYRDEDGDNVYIVNLFIKLAQLLKRTDKKKYLAIVSETKEGGTILIKTVIKIILESMGKQKIRAPLLETIEENKLTVIKIFDWMIDLSVRLHGFKQQNQSSVISQVETFMKREYFYSLKQLEGFKGTKWESYVEQSHEMITFLKENSQKLLVSDNYDKFELNFYVLLIITLLNCFKINGVSLNYTKDFKTFGKQLKSFQVEPSNRLFDYFIEVLKYSHARAKQKRIGEVGVKPSKEQALSQKGKHKQD